MCYVLSDERESLSLIFLLASAAQSSSGPTPVGLATIFYCLRIYTSFFVASYDAQDYDGVIRPPPRHGIMGFFSLSPSCIYDRRLVGQVLLE
jgi:hypothetical protein